MLKPTLLPVLLLAAGAGPLHAQTDYYARAGAMWASTLVRDVLVTEVTVQQSVAPMVALGASCRSRPAIAPASRPPSPPAASRPSRTASKPISAPCAPPRSCWGWTGRSWQNLRWRVGLGGLFYLPSEDRGIFLEGGPIRFVAGAGADWRRPVMTKWDLMVSARYDLHRFTTDELEQRGFSQAQGVSRVSLSVGLARGIR